MRRWLGGTLGVIALCLAPPAPAAPTALAFPPGFLWGTATAAHQVEGGLHNDWSEFERVPGAIRGGDSAALATDTFHRFDADFALAEDLHGNAHRLSIAWSRLEPSPGHWDPAAIAHYHQVFRSLLRHHLRPFVTLHHFTNPVWVAARGGWLNPETPADFARFAAFVGKEYGHEVHDWITINEPNVYAFQAYSAGVFPPAHHSDDEALQVMANLARAHVLAYHALHAADPAARVGLAQHIALFDPYAWWNPLDGLRARSSDDAFNRSFLRAVTTGEVQMGFPGARGVRTFWPEGRSAVDFIGINYYTRWRCTSFGPSPRVATPGAPVSPLGWEIYPQGLVRALELANAYTRLPDGRHVPLYVTENGVDDPSGEARSRFLVAHLLALHQAIAEGIDVRGYFHWTLTDNFEWAEGYSAKFGLYRIDRSPGADLKRIATPAVAVYRQIAQENALPVELLRRYAH